MTLLHNAQDRIDTMAAGPNAATQVFALLRIEAGFESIGIAVGGAATIFGRGLAGLAAGTY